MCQAMQFRLEDWKSKKFAEQILRDRGIDVWMYGNGEQLNGSLELRAES